MTTSYLTAPTAAQVLRARQHAKLTQLQAARLVHHESLQRWSEYERGIKQMPLARWELFILLTRQHPTLTVISAAAMCATCFDFHARRRFKQNKV